MLVIFVEDSTGQPLDGAKAAIEVDGEHRGNVITKAGQATFNFDRANRTTKVTVSFAGKSETATIAQDQDSYTFRLDIPARDRAPEWFAIVGVAAVGLTLLFFMGLVIASIFGHPIPENARPLIAIVTALGATMGFSFFAGNAAIEGELPFFKDSPITFVAGGAVAVFAIVLLLTNWVMDSVAGSQGQPTTPQATGLIDSQIVPTFVKAITEAREKGTMSPESPIPSDLSLVRAQFEVWWRDAPLSLKREIEHTTMYQALSQNARLYRLYDLEDETKSAAIHWNDQSINYFNEVQEPYFLVEALLDKAATYLELSQIEHTNPSDWQRIAEDGNAVMARAAALAKDHQLPATYRIWSRFYYNLARPKSGILSEHWDNNWLSQAYDKAKLAYSSAPDDIKNSTQYARAAQKIAANPPQDLNEEWTQILWKTQSAHKATFAIENENLRTPHERVPPLNILAAITLDAVQRELNLAGIEDSNVPAFIEEMTETAIKSQRETIALIEYTEWADEFSFDTRYDLARMQFTVVRLLDQVADPAADGVFAEALRNLQAARGAATSRQLDAMKNQFSTSPEFTQLEAQRFEAATMVLN